ncbi:ferric iron uptake transcriptional regulator [Methylophaga sp.]|uniref:ferric iron uptake transcriptional regulator n=3 Tax=Methylophaga TaxID=40222 RepID=UPI003A907A6E
MIMERQDLRKAGLKITLPRLKVLEILEHSKQRHLSAEDVYKALLEMGEEIGLATVYRVLTQFEGAGLVSRLNIDGGHAVFELEDGEHHDHLFCVKCNRIIEFYDEVIEERQKAIAKANGFEMTDHSLYIYGICNREDCKKER